MKNFDADGGYKRASAGEKCYENLLLRGGRRALGRRVPDRLCGYLPLANC